MLYFLFPHAIANELASTIAKATPAEVAKCSFPADRKAASSSIFPLPLFSLAPPAAVPPLPPPLVISSSIPPELAPDGIWPLGVPPIPPIPVDGLLLPADDPLLLGGKVEGMLPDPEPTEDEDCCGNPELALGC